MANSTSNLDLISASQAQKEVTANALLDAGSPGTAFGRRASTSSGLTWGYYGGKILVDGVITEIANGTVALTNSATNFIERTRAGVVSRNTSAFTPGQIPLYTAVCSGGVVTSYTDHRSTEIPTPCGRLVKAMADANQTLTAAEARNRILEATGALTALRNLVVPLALQEWIVFANVSGGFGVQVIGASGTGVTIADGTRAIVYADGTNVVRVTPDT